MSAQYTSQILLHSYLSRHKQKHRQQHFYNNSEKGHFARFKGDRIPNRPYYFANAGADYCFKNIISKDDKILLYWHLRYTHQYFLSWESLGDRSSKQVIPDQTLQNIGISYSMPIKDKPSTLSVEIQNFTNKKAYDFFGVQRPGRAVFMKVITQF
ncbi:TonB-dependent receptor [Sporocytophaga myxococcoides]|uniref:TonB-dependent receptor n=1 Tax=Sporocytophaga myxococcoides TaxID=153721 RepID=UPI00138ADD2A|nr:TonB-dependent receptor [Sporocytophaga myxococcoides]